MLYILDILVKYIVYIQHTDNLCHIYTIFLLGGHVVTKFRNGEHPMGTGAMVKRGIFIIGSISGFMVFNRPTNRYIRRSLGSINSIFWSTG